MELIPLIDYTQFTLLYKSLGMSPFKLNYRYTPLTLYNWDRLKEPVTVYKELNVADAKALATYIYNAWTIAKGFI